MAKWCTGTQIPINVYDGDVPVCQCQTVEYARLIVQAVNVLKALGIAAEDPEDLSPELLQALRQLWHPSDDLLASRDELLQSLRKAWAKPPKKH